MNLLCLSLFKINVGGGGGGGGGGADDIFVILVVKMVHNRCLRSSSGIKLHHWPCLIPLVSRKNLAVKYVYISTYLVNLPHASIFLPAYEVAGEAGQGILDAVLYGLHELDHVRVGRDVREEGKDVGLILPFYLLGGGLYTCAIHPANKRLTPVI